MAKREILTKMAEVKQTSNSQIVDEIPKKTAESNAQIVSNWSKFKKAIQAVFYFKVKFHPSPISLLSGHQTLVTVLDLVTTNLWSGLFPI